MPRNQRLYILKWMVKQLNNTYVETSDGPPTLERSGSERREGAVSSSLRFLSPTRGIYVVVKTIGEDRDER